MKAFRACSHVKGQVKKSQYNDKEGKITETKSWTRSEARKRKGWPSLRSRVTSATHTGRMVVRTGTQAGKIG
jgi:hypothetical protein